MHKTAWQGRIVDKLSHGRVEAEDNIAKLLEES
jgi:hypothetical protein